MITFLIGLFSVICGFVLGAIYGREFANRAEKEAKSLRQSAEEQRDYWKGQYDSLIERAKRKV
jgi:hypothetical protein